MADAARMPCLFIPHGGGPCFFMQFPPPFPPDAWDKMGAFLRSAAADIAPRPRAILVISGHWDAPRPTVHAATDHKLLFDYYGFPEHTYRLTYPAKGAPDVAARVRTLLGEAGIASDEESARGLDHGVFIPFMLLFPDADIPIVQLSLRQDMDAAAHIAMGKALAPLRDEGVLIVGSGMSFHNLRTFFTPGDRGGEAAGFDSWLTESVTASDPAIRNARLEQWATAPFALACHPEPEHLLPLHVVAGAAGDDAGRHVYSDRVMGKAVSGYRFG
jgi:aromatic ring-opening dioxygenase catalytic subunit (LigB family)